MNAELARLDRSGRLLVPAKIRSALGINEGDSLLLRVDEEGLHLSTQAQALARAQTMVRRAAGKDRSLVDELLAERRRETQKEDP
ncbi:MAG: AbrB/MazE/SpoVT family DNA-binding domain-containing protein [Acidobacteria bacterium]|nr:AbrB/MazE/SpoVT family DNA-binding domain-containing protein [Acidobacteriota bacterium]